jgi:hypothetical protein
MIKPFKFWCLTGREKCLFIEALMLLLLAALCVRTVAFKRLHLFLNSRFNSVAPSCNAADVTVIERSISQATNALAWKNVCLIRSIAAFVMLRRRGFPVVLLAGVKVLEDSTLGAHAWLDTGHKDSKKVPPNCDFVVVLEIGSRAFR